jgi:outer membrane immunogenic protein
MKNSLAFAVLAVCLTFARPANAQAAKPSTEKPAAEISITYSALHGNVPPGNCGCFWMRGGSGELTLPVWRPVSGVAEISGERLQKFPGLPTIGLTLVSYMAGPRYTHPLPHRLSPFAQALFGGVHGFDSYFPSANGGPSGAATSFAMAAGLGLDIALRPHLLLRAIQADYHYMQLPNNALNPANQQHNIRLSAGLVFRFTR